MRVVVAGGACICALLWCKGGVVLPTEVGPGCCPSQRSLCTRLLGANGCIAFEGLAQNHCSPSPLPTNAHHLRPWLALQYLAPPHIIVRKGLVQGLIYPRLADHLASFLAETLFYTSLLALPSDEFK